MLDKKNVQFVVHKSQIAGRKPEQAGVRSLFKSKTLLAITSNIQLYVFPSEFPMSQSSQ